MNYFINTPKKVFDSAKDACEFESNEYIYFVET